MPVCHAAVLKVNVPPRLYTADRGTSLNECTATNWHPAERRYISCPFSQLRVHLTHRVAETPEGSEGEQTGDDTSR